MTTAKKIAAPATPAKPVATKQSAKKATPRKAASKKIAAKKPLSKAFAPPNPSKTVKPVKAEKPKKPKLVRDSFTIPKGEYVVLEALKQRAAKLTRSVKKSELLRAGIKALAAMSDAAFLNALTAVPTIKTGRPSTAK